MRRQFKALISRGKSEQPPSSSGGPNSRSQLQPAPDPLANVNHQPVPSSSAVPAQLHHNVGISSTPTASLTSTPNPALKRAMERHIRELSDADKTAFTKASSKDINKLLEEVRKLDDEHTQQSSFRKYTTRITNFLNIFNLSVSGASVFLQSEKTASIVLGGAKLVIGLALNYVEYFDQVSKMLDQLSKYLAPLARYAEKCDLPNICNALADVYADVLRFYSAARRLFVDDTGNAKKHASFTLFLRSQWSPFSVEFGEIETSLQGHNDILLHSGVSEILVNSSKEKEEFQRWLSGNNFDLKKAKSLEARHSGTCDWLFDTDEFKKWLSSTAPEMLWCYGKPGSGKSILASQVIQNLQDDSHGANSIVCFAYFTVANTPFGSSRSLILALFKQLCRQQDRVPEWLMRAKREDRHPEECATIDNLIEMTASYSEVFIVIDGLDECPDTGRRSVLDFLGELRFIYRPLFKIFMTSRKKSDIARYFDCKGVLQVTTDSEGTTNDINCLIRQRTESLRQSQDLLIKSDVLFEKVVSTLIKNADGMFLWVVLQLDHLRSLETDSQISRALERMPIGLTDTYSRIIGEINRKDPYQRSLAIACFRWILSATRELRWFELRMALPLADPCPPKSYEACVDGPSITFVSSACGNLVHIPKKKLTWWGDEKITFIHSSVFHFFSENLATLGYTEDPWMILSEADAMNYRNALDCMSYLCLLIEEGLDLNEDLGPQVEYNAFAYYSIHNFDTHLIASNEASRASSTMLDVVEQLLNRDEAFLETFLNLRLMLHSDVAYGLVSESQYLRTVTAVPEHILWTTQLHKIMTKRVSQQPPSTTLRLLAESGLLEATENFIQQGVFKEGRNSIDEEDEYGRSALYIASQHGHPLLIELLIREGARIQPLTIRHDSGDYFEQSTSLSVAVTERRHEAVEVLIKAGANVNIPVRLSGALFTLWTLAKLNKDDPMVRILEESGAKRLESKAEKTLTLTEADDTVGGAEIE